MKNLLAWFNTTFVRMALMIALLLIGSQVSIFFLVQHFMRDSHAQDLARRWAQVLVLASHLPVAQHEAAKELLGLNVHVLTPDQFPVPQPQPNPFLIQVSQNLRGILGSSVRIEADPAQHVIRLFWAGPRAVEVKLPIREAIPKSLPWIQLLAILLVSLIGGFLAARQSTRPLIRLVDRLEKFRHGEKKSTLIARGPRDIRQLIERFNRLVTEIDALIDERELVLVGVSHDLRTPLTRMRLAVELLEKSQSDLRDDLIENVREMDEIIQRFIAYVREGTEEKLEPTNLVTLIVNTIERFQEIHALDVSLQAVPVPDLHLGKTGCERIFSNILENVVQHGLGPVEIQLIVGRSLNRVIVKIRDHGSGIPAHLIADVTKPFFMAGKGANTGLGLAIVERLMRHQGGDVSLSNHPEGGLLVMLTFSLDASQRLGYLRRSSSLTNSPK
ncbi:ATP-binding protein [Acidithiobacillus thiooxidans]|uniref:histidine kinase n=1 Tax=Acidithiobacillus thiooxidans ATCC 19377 TaxID=637390 RepID=A0A543Q574_ACITH|nr:ATP-binding protein [Acidithiobacillus thiooxidans]MDX5934410.1 ATP-binding protein [Acidithiobacillus thiooxidans]TQN51475.1 Osmolarity sensor protein EnvZ [Acidithiobacillus thiooxidans ATCC 19377]